MAKTAAIYARYSSHAQDESSSIEVQLQHCTRTLGTDAKHYIDEARTGRSLAGRTALASLIADARAGLISKVCVWRFSRIGRNLADSASIIQQLEDCDVQIVSAMEGSDSLVRSIFLGMAEHYSKELASNTRDGLAARFQQRAFTRGCAPFGYQIVEQEGVKRLVLCDTEAKTIREIVDLYLRENIGLKLLCRRLEQTGIATRKGARWCHTTLRAILLNPMLVGKVRFLRRQMKINRESGRRVPKFRDEPQVLEYDDQSLRIVTDEQFERIQKTLTSRKPSGKTPRMPREVRAFTGFAFCAECGTACYTCKSQNSKGTYHYLACGNRCRHGKDACPLSGRVREDKLLETVRMDYDAIFENADEIIAGATERAKELSKSQQENVSRIQVEIGEIDRKTKPLLALLVDPEIDSTAKKAVSRQIGELEQRREQLHEATTRLAREAGETTEKLASAIRQAMDEAKQSLASITSPAEFNRFVARFVGVFEVRSDGSFGARKSPGRMLSHPTGDIAGGGFEPPTSGL